MPRRYPPGPINFNASFGLTWRHAYSLCRDPLGFVSWAAETYGDVVFYRVFNYVAYQVNHPDLIREVLVTKARSFLKADRQMNIIRQVAGDGLLSAEGELWMRQRRIMLPAFQTAAAQRMAEIGLKLAQSMMDDWEPGDEIDIDEAFITLLIRIVSEAFFAVETDREARWLGEQMSTVSRAMLDQISSVASLPPWVPFGTRWHQQRAQTALYRYVDEAIVHRRSDQTRSRDLLSVLLTAVDEEQGQRGMSDTQARCEAMTMFFAGHHTSAAALTWTVYLLSENPGVYETLLAEIDQVLEGRPPELNDIPRLPYTEMVLKESMRIYPPAWALFSRQTVEEVELGGYELPRGAWVFIYPWVTQRDPRVFPDPLRFDPERFAPQRASAIPTGAYFPFGLGAHSCIGTRMAMTTLMLVLPAVLQRFKYRQAPGQRPPIPEPLVSIRPKRGLRMIVEARPNAVPVGGTGVSPVPNEAAIVRA
ncbi:MAG TPA: cytochrome P450 [Pirellulaceae bacterium]|nr:cytochrome P450 [Pirellulaceae bacterium]